MELLSTRPIPPWQVLTGLVTYKQFAMVAKKNKWTPETLAKEHGDSVEAPLSYFRGVFDPKRANTVISLRSVLRLYFRMNDPTRRPK